MTLLLLYLWAMGAVVTWLLLNQDYFDELTLTGWLTVLAWPVLIPFVFLYELIS